MIKMIRLVLACALLFPFAGYAQEISEGAVKVGKVEKSGYIAVSKYSNAEVEEVIAKKLTAAGIGSGKKKSKFYTYKEIVWPAISPTKIDLAYKVQKKKHRCTIYFVVSKGYDNYVTSNSDGATSSNIKGFLASIDGLVLHNREVARKEAEVKEMNERVEQEKKDVQKAQEEKEKKAKELEDLKQKG